MMAMSKLKPSKLSIEIKCSACDGTGYPAVAQPKQPGHPHLSAALQTVLWQGSNR